MKFSKLSTIFFEENDFQGKSPLDIPIVPRGETMTIMELAEGFNITLLTSYPSMPASIDIVEERTQVRTAVANTATAPCTFTGTVPATMRPGIYHAEFLVRNTATAVSAPFRVVAGNDWGCIVGNSPSERYSDGTPSIVGGRRVKFYQYFRRKDFRLVPVESNTFYDDERGTSFSLQNKNFSRCRLEGYAGERTAAAVSMLLAGSWSMLTYRDKGGSRVNWRLHKTGDLTTEVVGRGFCQFSGDFNARRQKQIAISLDDAEMEGVLFNGSDNVIVNRHARGVPAAIFCLPYTNFEVEKIDGSLYTFDTSAHFTSIAFTSGRIPDNFGRAIYSLDTVEIRQSDKITEIGDNVKLMSKGVPIKANFTSIHKVGRNVTFGAITGDLRFSNNPVFDNLKVEAGTPIFCKDAVLKNCKLDYTIAGTIAELHNVDIDDPSFFGPTPVINRDALLSGCRFKYIAGTYTLYAQRLVGCRMSGTYDPVTKFNLRNFSGSIAGSFTYQRLYVDTDASTSSFRIDEESLHGYVTDDGGYLASVQRIDGRNILNAGTLAIAWTKVNDKLAYDYESVSDVLLANDGSTVSVGNIATASIGDRTPDDLLSGKTFVSALTLTLKGDLGRSNLNDVDAATSTVVIPATMLLGLLQSGGSYLNNIKLVLQVVNDLPDGFSYLLLKTNPKVLQNATLTVNVSGDTYGLLTNRLRELYPLFTINSI